MKKGDNNFRNFIEYPITVDSRRKSHSACGFMAATGDPSAPDPSVKAAVTNLTMWNYAKTGLALLGAFVAIKFIYGKIK
jgi:hypothetical protein